MELNIVKYINSKFKYISLTKAIFSSSTKNTAYFSVFILGFSNKHFQNLNLD